MSRLPYSKKIALLSRMRKLFPSFNKSGFTLLEMLVVMGIMALLTGMSAPAISGYLKTSRLKGAASEIASALRQARTLAITKRADYTVDFNATDREFWIEQNNTLPSGTKNDVVGDVNILPKTINYGAANTFNNSVCTFNPRGGANAGSVFIIDPKGNQWEITVTSTATGRVLVSVVP